MQFFSHIFFQFVQHLLAIGQIGKFDPYFGVKGSNSARYKNSTERFFKNPLFTFVENSVLSLLTQTVSIYL